MFEKFNSAHSLSAIAVVLLLLAVLVWIYDCVGCCKAKCDQCKGMEHLPMVMFAFAIFLLLLAIVVK